MTYWFRLYRAMLQQSWALMAQYRFSVLIWAVWGFVGPLISLAVWTAVSSARGSAIAGRDGASFARADFAGYFLVYMIFGHITMSWDVFEFAYRVRDGSLSPRLLRPVHPIHNDAAQNIGFKLFTSAVLLPVWILLFFLLRPAAPHSVVQLLLAAPALVLAAVMRYVWQYALAVLAFWTTRVDAINQLYFTLDSFLGGRIAPLALLPGWMGALSVCLPFRSMGAFPVELALGRVPPGQVAFGFAIQCVWLAAGIGVLRVVWNAGVKQYSAVGA